VSDVGIVVADDPGADAAQFLVEAARAGGQVALSGGGGVGAVYELAARIEPDWSRVELWWVDDRVVPPDHEHSNFRLVSETLLARCRRQPSAVHRIEGELPPDEAADRYDDALAGVELDLALMGIGPDGHTASLFPNGPELDERERSAVWSEARLEPLVPRVTMTIPFLACARTMVYLVTGDSKAEAVARAFGAQPSPQTPASLVRGRHTVAVLDKPAAARL
jgi:6-phosphogluconolactonase